MMQTAGFEDEILREQVRLAFKSLATMQLSLLAVAVALVLTTRGQVSAGNEIFWVGTIVLVASAGIVLHIRFRSVRREEFSGRGWSRAHLALMSASGVLWGLSAFLVLPVRSLPLTALFLLAFGGLAAAAAVSQSAVKAAPACWLVPAGMLYGVRLLLQGGGIYYALVALIVIYVLTLLRFSLEHNGMIAASIGLRFENQNLLDAARRSEDRFRSLFQGHDAVMLLIDPESGEIVDANKAASAFYGYSADALRRMRIQDVNALPPEEVRAERLRALHEERNFFVFPHRLATGELRTVEVHSSPIHTRDRTLLFSIIHDITKRRQAEEQLAESEASYRDLFDNLTDAILMLDEGGTLLHVNRGAEKMTGYSRELIVGRALETLAAPGRVDLGAVDVALGRAHAGDPQTLEFWGQRADGQVFPAEVHFVQGTYRGGRVVIAAARDISERRRAETEHMRAQKLEAIGTLAGGIAHDFNNLLQGVFGHIAMAKLHTDPGGRAQGLLEQAEKALQLSVNLTTQLLTFAKGGTPVRRRLKLGEVIEDSAKFALSGSSRDCRIAVPDDLWPAEVDGGQIGQVIQNLILNAHQSMPAGGSITVAARNVELEGGRPMASLRPGRWVEIVVTDTGVGIPEADLRRIFDPYFTTKESGSGLGLASAYSIVRNHGGSLDVTSTVGEGSAFAVYLPACDVEDAAEPRIAISGPPPPARILVMDDEDVVREVVGEMLSVLGHDVELAPEGDSAIEMYVRARREGAPFDLVILDVTVRGGLGGEDTMKKLRELDPAVVAVVSSGYSAGATLSDFAAHGFRAMLPKPFTFDELQAVLARVLNDGRGK